MKEIITKVLLKVVTQVVVLEEVITLTQNYGYNLGKYNFNQVF